MTWLLTSSLSILQKNLIPCKIKRHILIEFVTNITFTFWIVQYDPHLPSHPWDPWESGNVDWSDPSGVDNPSAAVSSHWYALNNAQLHIRCTLLSFWSAAHVPVIARFTRKQLPNIEGCCFASGQFAWKSKSQSSAMQNHLLVYMAGSLVP